MLIGSQALPAWLRWQRTSRDRAEAAALNVARLESAVSDQRAVRDSVTARRARLSDLKASWLDGDSPAAAGAELAAQISTVGEHAGVTIDAVDIRIDSSVTQSFTPVRVHATAVGDIEGIAGFLAGIENGRLLMAVRAVSIDAADPAPAPNRAEVLRAELTVEGAWLRHSLVLR